MGEDSRKARHAKGVNLVGLVKLLRAQRHKKPLRGLPPEGAALIEQRILVTNWYPLEQLWVLQRYVYQSMLQQNPALALQLGCRGGLEMWKGTHRAFVGKGDPSYGLRYMAAAWPNYFDFGHLEVTREDADSVRFAVHGYPDVPVQHGMMIAGWHLAAARLSGWPEASAEVTARPWDGAPHQEHVVRR